MNQPVPNVQATSATASPEARSLGLSHEELLPIFRTSGRRVTEYSDPAEFMNWMTESATEADNLESIEHDIRIATTDWTNKNFEDSGAWLSELSPSLLKDSAIDGFTSAVRGIDPEAAALWGAQITDSEQRKKNLEETLGRWGDSDSEAAQAWREKQGF